MNNPTLTESWSHLSDFTYETNRTIFTRIIHICLMFIAYYFIVLNFLFEIFYWILGLRNNRENVLKVWGKPFSSFPRLSMSLF